MGSQVRVLQMVALVVAMLLVNVVHGRTWIVERDGSGDFTVIQDAVDAADDGDTIAIGPGRYTEYTEFWWGKAYVWLDGTKSLTFVGSGVEATIVGPDVYASGFTDFGFRSDHGDVTIRIENLRVENQNYCGVGTYNTVVELVDCVVERCFKGVVNQQDIQRVLIENCQFINGPNQASSEALACRAPQIEIRNTEVNRYKSGFNLDYSGSTEVLVTGCTFNANSIAPNYGLVGLEFTLEAGGTVENCYFTGWINDAFAVGDAGTVIFRDNIVEDCPGTGVGLLGCLDFTMHDNVISQCNRCIFIGEPNDVQSIHNNHFFRNIEAEGYFIRTTGYFPFGPYRLDFTLNYWGTTDPAEIAEWIYDGRDDEDVWMYVEYEPMLSGPVGVEELPGSLGSEVTVYPNPFNPRTEIAFRLDSASDVQLDVYDLVGRLVRGLETGEFSAGSHSVTWDGMDRYGRPVPSGRYFARLRSGDQVVTRSMTLVR